ncbi:hypothetical protein GGR56DRAFT_617692 [Xylariaceae sp. FL0804]|nr:hypothetical protein GGR56DRAFT_617692 [Xylariaceae sp. FL0804]
MSENASDTTPLLPRPTPSEPPQGDSHPITLRVCHSPWKGINQKVLLGIRALLSAYLTTVFGVSMKYKHELDDKHSNGRIAFQFSTVSFCLLWGYHLIATLWTGMHLFKPHKLFEDPEDCEGHRIRTRVFQLLSPSNRDASAGHQFMFSMFYTIAHVFAFMNTLLYWAILVPAGHGGIPPPSLPHQHPQPPKNETVSLMTSPDKGLFEEGPTKSFSILNVWTVTSLIGCAEIFFLNSIRRQNPVARHAVGVMGLSCAYLVWAAIGKAATGHAGLFFLDPKLMNDQPGAVFAACVGFVMLSSGVFTYMYGMIAAREAVTARS